MVLTFASAPSASVYKWVDERRVVNYSDNYSRVPPHYRNKVATLSQTSPEDEKVGALSGKTPTQTPPVAQPLVREGDFAIKLAEELKIGKPESEAEAESLLTSVGIAPKNGWIADYPVTPDVIAELEDAIGEVADAGILPMGKDEALKAFRTAGLELELPIVAEVSDLYAETPPPTTPQYTESTVINNYYDTEGPPVVTYYPPPPDYYYLYAWIPSPFWYTGFYFPGFYMLYDFHRVVFIHRRPCVITNHVRDHRTGSIFVIHPKRRHEGRSSRVRGTPQRRGFDSSGAREGARSIFERSRQRAALGNVTTPIKDGRRNNSHPAYSNASRRGDQKQVYNRENRPSGFNGQNNAPRRPPVADHRMTRTRNEPVSHDRGGRTLSRRDSKDRQNGMNFRRPSPGETRSYGPSARGRERSISSPLQGGGKLFGSSPMGSRSFSGSHQGGNRRNGFGHGGLRF